jgi:transcriptional regulator
MYKLPYFTESNNEVVFKFMQQHAFALVIGNSDAHPIATQLPLIVAQDEKGDIFISGHFMRNTDHHIAFESNSNVLVIFNGPHAYVSASWYSNKASASTWNYITVHAKGVMEFVDETKTIQLLKQLTDQYENQESAAAFHHMSDDYIQKMAKAVVGFSIKVSSVENVYKLSQNHTEENRRNIVAELLKRGDDNSINIAQLMQERF